VGLNPRRFLSVSVVSQVMANETAQFFLPITSAIHSAMHKGDWDCTLIKKEHKIFLINNEIQRDRLQSHMTNGLLIYWEKFAHFLIY
jgi:hypothetical protein